MKRHSTDLVSLLSGLTFAALGVAFALDAIGTYRVDLSVVPAIVFIVFGLGISASVLLAARSPRPEPVFAAVEADHEADRDPDAEPPLGS